MSKLAKTICKHKKIILIITLLLLIPSIIGIKNTKINYDILVYLPDNELNKTYRWKMYKADGTETTDVSEAKTRVDTIDVDWIY